MPPPPKSKPVEEMRIDCVEIGEMGVNDMGKTDNQKGNEIAAHITRQSLKFRHFLEFEADHRTSPLRLTELNFALITLGSDMPPRESVVSSFDEENSPARHFFSTNIPNDQESQANESPTTLVQHFTSARKSSHPNTLKNIDIPSSNVHRTGLSRAPPGCIGEVATALGPEQLKALAQERGHAMIDMETNHSICSQENSKAHHNPTNTNPFFDNARLSGPLQTAPKVFGT